MDDVGIVVQNEDIREINIHLIFTTHYFSGSALPVKSNLYRPVTKLSYAIDYAGAGLNPKRYHLVNIIYHLITTIILFLLLMRFFPQSCVPYIASILFLVTPINVKTVAYIANRCGILEVMFGLLAWYLHNQRKEILSAGFLFLSLLSKETAIIWVIVFFIYDIFYKKSIRASIVPHIVAIVLYSILRINAVGLERIPTPYFLSDEGILVRLFTTAKCIVFFYFLRGFTGTPFIPGLSSRCIIPTENTFPPSFEALIAIIIIITLLVIAFIKRNKIIYKN